MSLPLGYADDYLAWDRTESVTLEVGRRVGQPATTAVPVAKRRAITSREKSPSGGAYVGYEVRWHLPTRVLPPGQRIKPGDAILDQHEVRWTVLTADLNRLGYTWALGCVDLVLAHDLADVVTIETADISYDGAGAAVKAFPPAGGQVLYQGIPARVQLLTDEVADERGIRSFRGRYSVIVGLPVDVTFEDRVNWTDPKTAQTILLDITGVHNPDRIDELQALDCEVKP